jgi:hypothetical protein
MATVDERNTIESKWRVDLLQGSMVPVAPASRLFSRSGRFPEVSLSKEIEIGIHK